MNGATSREMTNEIPCPECGYTQADVDLHRDHRLCDGPGPMNKTPEVEAEKEWEDVLDESRQPMHCGDEKCPRVATLKDEHAYRSHGVARAALEGK